MSANNIHHICGRSLSLLVIFLAGQTVTNAQLLVSVPEVSLLYTGKVFFAVILNTPVVSNNSHILLSLNHKKVLTLDSEVLNVVPNVPTQSWNLTITGKHPGNAIIEVSLDPPQESILNTEVHVAVEKDVRLGLLSHIIGWIYFTAWTISFYPQIYTNFKKKSVIGLNFDFLCLNILGFALYSLYNLGYYSSSLIQDQFYEKNGTNANPVQLNDVFFSIHATVVTVFTIFQCFIYERGTQRVSIGARLLVAAYFVYLAGVVALVLLGHLQWIEFLNQCSHVKLTITLIKYIPQAYMNFQRKSTSGWSIGNVLLDLMGGLFSILQMVVLAFNFDDWDGFLIDTTKIGLGVFSVSFDILFMVQHYILYRHSTGIYDLDGNI